jgi:hypothetical protein
MRIPSTAWRPSMNLPTLDHIAPRYEQWVTPKLGQKSTQNKGNHRLGWEYGKFHNATGRIPSKEPTYVHHSQTPIPHMHVLAWEYSPSLYHSPLAASLLFQGFSNRLDQELSELCSNKQTLLPGESFSEAWQPTSSTHGTNNPPLQTTSLTT